jgi:hypothetical protein
VSEAALHRPLRISVAALWLTGATISALTAVLGFVRVGPGTGAVFTAIAAGLVLLAAGVLRRNRLAVAASLVLLAAQLAGAIGSAWELATSIDEAKAGQLRDLGFDPTFGVVLNLLYSTVAFAVFAWFAVRWLRARVGRG